MVVETQAKIFCVVCKWNKKALSDYFDLFCGAMDGDSWTRPQLVLLLGQGGVFGLNVGIWLLSLIKTSSEM